MTEVCEEWATLLSDAGECWADDHTERSDSTVNHALRAIRRPHESPAAIRPLLERAASCGESRILPSIYVSALNLQRELRRRDSEVARLETLLMTQLESTPRGKSFSSRRKGSMPRGRDTPPQDGGVATSGASSSQNSTVVLTPTLKVNN